MKLSKLNNFKSGRSILYKFKVFELIENFQIKKI